MKEVIGLSGDIIRVPIGTPVKTINGKHYLLTEKDKEEQRKKEADYKVAQEFYVANELYKDQRRRAYPSVEEQLDLMHKSRSDWRKIISDIKAKYPKPNNK